MHTNDPLIKTIWIFLLSQAVSFTRYQLCIKNWSQPITYPTLTHQIFLCYILDYFVHNTSGYVISLSNWTSLNCERKSLSNKRKKTFYVSDEAGMYVFQLYHWVIKERKLATCHMKLACMSFNYVTTQSIFICWLFLFKCLQLHSKLCANLMTSLLNFSIGQNWYKIKANLSSVIWLCTSKGLSCNLEGRKTCLALKDSHNHKLHGDNQMHACNHTHMHAHIHTDINRVEREQRKLQTRSADTVTALVLLTM